MHIRIRLAVAVAVTALAATACGAVPGTSVNDQPKEKTASSAAASTPAEDAPAEETSAPPKVATVGDTIALTGMEEGSGLDVTVVKVTDNAKSSDEYSEPQDGQRWLGVQFQLVNTGTVAYGDSPANGAQIADEQGQQFDTTFAEITAGPAMSSDVKLKPGAKTLGWIVFELPKDSKADIVQFTMDSGFAEQTGEWKLP